MLYIRITEPEKGGVWQGVVDCKDREEARKKISRILGFDPGQRLVIEPLPNKTEIYTRELELTYTNVSKSKFLEKFTRPN